MDVVGLVESILGDALLAIVNVLVAILPTSPFESVMYYFSKFEYLPYINYFIPVDAILAFMELWITAVALWYVYCFVIDIIGWVSSSGNTSVSVK